jgi:hypothetical protein
VAWRNLALTSCVLLVQLVGWLASLPDSREPLMGLAARLALSYQLLWCAIAVSSPKQLPIAIGIVLVVTYPTGWASWIVLGYAYTIFNDFGPFGLVIGFVLGALANAVVITAPLMLIEILLADSTVAHRLALRSAMALALRHVMGGAAVLPLTIAAMILHMDVSSRGHANPCLLILPTPPLILAHFLLEAGTAVPHALLTLPRRVTRAWLSLPIVASSPGARQPRPRHSLVPTLSGNPGHFRALWSSRRKSIGRGSGFWACDRSSREEVAALSAPTGS